MYIRSILANNIKCITVLLYMVLHGCYVRIRIQFWVCVAKFSYSIYFSIDELQDQLSYSLHVTATKIF